MKLKVSIAQLAPVWLNKEATIEKAIMAIKEAFQENSDLVIFGEGFLPGYPFWLSMTNGSAFNNQTQKEIHAHYVKNAISIENGDIDPILAVCKENKIAAYLGMIERPTDRGGHSLYCSLTYINKEGVVQSVHRKLQPTYEERLTWSPGDGHGLQVHSLNGFTVGGLNCWENWMPLARAAMYGQGENVHIAVWPGSVRNTEDITPFIAKESRSYSIGVSSLMRISDFPKDTPHLEEIIKNSPDPLTDGGSCIANPDGSWLVEPILNKEGVFTAELDFDRILEERQNFDPVGHYSRPDVTELRVNKERQSTVKIVKE